MATEALHVSQIAIIDTLYRNGGMADIDDVLVNTYRRFDRISTRQQVGLDARELALRPDMVHAQ